MQNKSSWKYSRYIKDSRGDYKINFEVVNPKSFYIFNRLLKTYVKVIQNNTKGHLLDCGCGLVPYYGIYKDLIDSNTCVDWENTEHKNQFIDKFADLNERLPLDDQAFDTVLLTDVLEHIAEPNKLISEIGRVLKKNGKLILGVPFFYWIHEAPFDYHRYTKFALMKLCEENHLEIVSLETYGGYPDILLDLFNKYFGRNKRLGTIYFSIANFISNLGYIKRMRENTVENFPLGYCLVARKL